MRLSEIVTLMRQLIWLIILLVRDILAVLTETQEIQTLNRRSGVHPAPFPNFESRSNEGLCTPVSEVSSANLSLLESWQDDPSFRVHF